MPEEPIKPIEKQVNEKLVVEKLPKIEKLEHKEKPEKFEHKEKPEKIEHKEKPEKVEHKEKPEKVEHKEFKEKEFILDKIVETNPNPGGPVEQRLCNAGAGVAALNHFITTGQRPDLSRGALTNEPEKPA